MERDDHLTFREIHGSEEALAEEMTRLETYLYEDKLFDKDFPLRFLTPCGPPPTYEDDNNTVHLRLTSLGEYDTSHDYVTVSYTWEQSPLLEAVYGSVAPNYLVWMPGTTSRPLFCPRLVVYRALAFASSMLELPLIWIDQECIHQTDAKDLEYHLERMYMVYRKSSQTVALLSKPVTSIDLFQSLARLPKAVQALNNFGDSRLNRPDIAEWPGADWAGTEFQSVEDFLFQDKWFTRLWTFNERRCCKRLHYAVVASLDLVDVLLTIAKDPHQAPLLVLLLQTAPFRDKSLRHRFALDFYIDSNALYEPLQHYREWLPSYLKRQGESSYYKMAREKSETYFGLIAAGNFFSLTRSLKGQIRDFLFALEQMRRLECSFQCDRLTIVSNICGLSRRLRLTELNKPGVSYSTCLLLLLAEMATKTGKRGLERNRHIAVRAMNTDVLGFVRIARQFGLAYDLGSEVAWSWQERQRRASEGDAMDKKEMIPTQVPETVHVMGSSLNNWSTA